MVLGVAVLLSELRPRSGETPQIVKSPCLSSRRLAANSTSDSSRNTLAQALHLMDTKSLLVKSRDASLPFAFFA
jgi:hypothetical protein